jgi:very-short-patch-repair endonuclease
MLVDLAREGGWAKPAINELVCGIEVDFSYPQWNLVFEADGYRFHGNKVKFEDDHEDRLYLEANGQRVIAVTYDQLTRRRTRTRARLERIIRSYAGADYAVTL